MNTSLEVPKYTGTWYCIFSEHTCHHPRSCYLRNTGTGLTLPPPLLLHEMDCNRCNNAAVPLSSLARAAACMHSVSQDVCLCRKVMTCEDAQQLVTSVAASGPQVSRSWGSKSLVRKLRMEQHASLHQRRGLRSLSSIEG